MGKLNYEKSPEIWLTRSFPMQYVGADLLKK